MYNIFDAQVPLIDAHPTPYRSTAVAKRRKARKCERSLTVTARAADGLSSSVARVPDMRRTSAREIAALAALPEQLQQWPSFAVMRRARSG